MAYVKHSWEPGETLSEVLLDHLETQYDENTTDLTTHTDTDTAPTAIHHTVGTGAFQIAAGNHTH